MVESSSDGIPLSNLTDEELSEMFRQTGDRETISILFDRYAHLVLGLSMKYLGNREDARDAAAEVFRKLIPSLGKYEITNFKAWLVTVARNQCAMMLRERKKEGIRIGWEDYLVSGIVENREDFHLNHEDVNEKEELIRKLYKALDKLPQKQQHCLLLFYFEGKSYREIEEMTGFTNMEVKSHIQNGKRKLKLLIENPE